MRVTGFTDEQTKAKTEFVVQAPETGETALLACNEVLLQDMAKESGGQYLREEQAGQLTRILDPLSSGRVVESDTLLWQSWWWFGAIMTLLGAEWYMLQTCGHDVIDKLCKNFKFSSRASRPKSTSSTSKEKVA